MASDDAKFERARREAPTIHATAIVQKEPPLELTPTPRPHEPPRTAAEVIAEWGDADAHSA